MLANFQHSYLKSLRKKVGWKNIFGVISRHFPPKDSNKLQLSIKATRWHSELNSPESFLFTPRNKYSKANLIWLILLAWVNLRDEKYFKVCCLAAPSYLPRRKIHLPLSLFTCLHGGKNFCETFPRINAISSWGEWKIDTKLGLPQSSIHQPTISQARISSRDPAPVITTIITVPSPSGRRQGR